MTTRTLLFSVTVKDCRVDTFRCGGHGGQNVNKVESGVRITHPPSGAVGQSCDTRDQFRNKRTAWRRMVESKEFQAWHKRETARLLTGDTVDDIVDRAMQPSHLRVEVHDGKGWEPWQD